MKGEQLAGGGDLGRKEEKKRKTIRPENLELGGKLSRARIKAELVRPISR